MPPPATRARGRRYFRSTAVEQIWHIQDGQGQIQAFASRHKPFNPFMLFPSRSEADASRSPSAEGRQTPAAPEQIGNTLKGFEGVYLNANARIWP